MLFRWLSAWCCLLGAIQVGVVASALLRLSLTQGLSLAIAALAIAAAVGAQRFSRDESAASKIVEEATNAADAAEPWVLKLAARAVALVSALVFALSCISAWFKPDWSWDGLTYHVPTIQLWAQRGYVHWIAFDYDPGPYWSHTIDALFNGYAKGGELHGFFLMQLTGREGAINAYNPWFLVLGALGIASLSRSLGASRSLSLLAVALYGLVPINVTQSVTTYVDAALSACVIAALAAACEAARALRAGRSPWHVWPALGSAFGLCVALKGSGITADGILLAALVGCVALPLQPLDAAPQEHSASSKRWLQALGFLAATCALALLVGGYWYGRNWVMRGNPLFPVRVAPLGIELFRGVPLHAQLAEAGNTPVFMHGWGALHKLAHTWLQGRSHWPESIRFYDSREGGLGFLWLCACVPALVVLLTRRQRLTQPSRVTLGVLAFAVSLYFLLTPMNWWARYTGWLYGLGLPSLAIAATLLFSTTERPVTRLLAALWLAECGLLAVFEGLYSFSWASTTACFLGEPQAPRSLGDVTRVLGDFRRPSFFFESRDPLLRRAATGDRAIAISPQIPAALPLLGYLCTPVAARAIYPMNPALSRDEAALRAFVAQRKIAYVLWNPTLGPAPALDSLGARVAHSHYWDVFELDPAAKK